MARRLSRDFWFLLSADAVSMLGTTMTQLALPLLVITTLNGSAGDVGNIRAAQFAPYLLVGLLAGVWVDRRRRLPVLIAADVLSAALFLAIALMALAGRLSLPLLAVLIFCAGTLNCLAVAAYQSFVPRLVGAGQLPLAFGRLGQMESLLTAAGPGVAGLLIKALGAPIALAIDALTYAVSALLLTRITTREADLDEPSRNVWAELIEGARWVYGHSLLKHCAFWLHGWFVFSTFTNAVLVYYLVVDLGLNAAVAGLIIAATGVTGLVFGGRAAPWGERWGVGRVMTRVEWVSPAWALLILFAPHHSMWTVPVLVFAHLLLGIGVIDAALMMSYRNAITPDRLRARMNATIRTVNWGGLALTSILSGWVADQWGTRVALAIGAAGMLAVTAYLRFSPFRSAVMPSTDSVKESGDAALA